MQHYILCSNSTLAFVKQHIICYEFQNRGLLHAHIIFLLTNLTDVKRITNEITAIILAIYDDNIT